MLIINIYRKYIKWHHDSEVKTWLEEVPVQLIMVWWEDSRWVIETKEIACILSDSTLKMNTGTLPLDSFWYTTRNRIHACLQAFLMQFCITNDILMQFSITNDILMQFSITYCYNRNFQLWRISKIRREKKLLWNDKMRVCFKLNII